MGRRHHGFRLFVMTIALTLVLAACGTTSTTSLGSSVSSTGHHRSSATGHHKGKQGVALPTSFQAAGCAIAPLSAAMDGAISSCYRIPNVPSGTYLIGIQALLSARGKAADAVGLEAPSGFLGPAVSLTATPTVVHPGQSVTITGTISKAPSLEPGHIYICLGGCIDGLHYVGVSVHWQSPRTFTASFVTPNGPWIERDPVHLVQSSGRSVSVGVECLGVYMGCALGHSKGSTTIRFLAAPTSSPALRPSTSIVVPGAVIHVKGITALTSILGANSPFVDSITMVSGVQSKRIATGVYRLREPSVENGEPVLLDPVKITVTNPYRFATLNFANPTAIQTSADPSIYREAGTRGTVLACTEPSTIEVLASGQSTNISTVPVADLLERVGVATNEATSELCNAIAALHTPSGINVIAASYAINSPSQATNSADLPVITTNDGNTWSVIPSPTGQGTLAFSTIATTRDQIDVYFLGPHDNLVIEATTNGLQWHSTRLSCPKSGPCIMFQPGVNTSGCPMNNAYQAINFSKNAGDSFAPVPWPSAVSACTPSELFSIDKAEFLLEPTSVYPLRESTDGGATWHVIDDLPTPPGASLVETSPVETSPLTSTQWGLSALVLPTTGDFLSLADGMGGSLLTPHAQRWCAVSTSVLPKDIGAAITGRSHLYYEAYDSQQDTLLLHELPLRLLRCAN